MSDVKKAYRKLIGVPLKVGDVVKTCHNLIQLEGCTADAIAEVTRVGDGSVSVRIVNSSEHLCAYKGRDFGVVIRYLSEIEEVIDYA